SFHGAPQNRRLSRMAGKKMRKPDDDGGDDHLDEHERERQEAIAQRKFLIESWNARDELYKQIFGQYSYVSPSNYVPPSENVKFDERDPNTVNGGSGDPGDPDGEEMHLGILAYGPDPLRPYWTYVTAGLCTPWLQKEPDEVSGFGCELMIKSPVDAA